MCRSAVKKTVSKGKYEMAWNKTQAVVLYAAIIWLLYKQDAARGGGAQFFGAPEWGTTFQFGAKGQGRTLGSPIELTGGTAQ
jgi:hypothetical protein